MIRREVCLHEEAESDLPEGRDFYNRIEPMVGDYFYDSLIADLESLSFFGGIHPKHHGLYRMLANFDMRRNPAWSRAKLGKRNT